MFKKIKSFFTKKPVAEFHDYDDYEDDDFELDDEDLEETEEAMRKEMEESLIKYFSNMDVKNLTFGEMKIGFKAGFSKNGLTSSLGIYELLGPVHDDLKSGDFPESPAVKIDFLNQKSVRTLIEVLEEHEAKMFALEIKYRENELLDEDEII